MKSPVSARNVDVGDESLFFDGAKGLASPKVRKQFFENIAKNKSILVPSE